MPGGMGGMGGMPGGMGGIPPELAGIFSDPELMALFQVGAHAMSSFTSVSSFQDPEVMQAYMEIMQNPGSIAKYMTNPKVRSRLLRPISSIRVVAGDETGAADPVQGERGGRHGRRRRRPNSSIGRRFGAATDDGARTGHRLNNSVFSSIHSHVLVVGLCARVLFLLDT
jgi:hypothetical protein